MNQVTQVLHALAQGDPSAASQLLPLVYEELRLLAAQKLVHETPGQTLQPTALVHEAYLRLVGAGEELHWNSRGRPIAWRPTPAPGCTRKSSATPRKRIRKKTNRPWRDCLPNFAL